MKCSLPKNHHFELCSMFYVEHNSSMWNKIKACPKKSFSPGIVSEK